MSSAKGRAGIALVRLSGPEALDALAALCPGLRPKPRHAHHAQLADPRDGSGIDAGIVVFFPAPHSFTGEDVVEINTHGSPAVIERLFSALARLGLRAAAPGEFTRRAFANGKMDLTGAEGLADLIASDSDSQRIQALAQMGGAWVRRIADWQAALLDALAWLEAGIDFADEGDVPVEVDTKALAPIQRVAGEMAAMLADGRIGEIIRDGLRVVIVGPPNVGKSTLLNALAGREAAIVSEMPGTTRDIVEVRLDLDGYVVILSDTAGLRESADPIEIEGVRRASERARGADLRIFVVDGSNQDSAGRVGLETESLKQAQDIVFLNKADLAGNTQELALPGSSGAIWGSARNNDLGTLLDAIKAQMQSRLASREGALITRARHREALASAHAALVRAVAVAPDLAAEDVRLALQALARIVGRFDVEKFLDRIFSAFCIGK